MRIWSLHPKYLDSKGLVALWRETLLAKHVLEGTTKGYKNHPQLNRFKASKNPLDCINQYLDMVHKEAVKRGYKFNRNKFDENYRSSILTVTDGQLEYETEHLLKKLKKRDKAYFEKMLKISSPETHPLFKTVKGDIEDWEIV